MHWSTDVYNAPEFTYSNVHFNIPNTAIAFDSRLNLSHEKEIR